MANNPLVGFSDAMRIQVRTGWWVFVLIGLEVLRQVHFLISEHWAAYNRFWTEKVFGGFERMTHRRISDWSRFRIRRIVTWVLWIAIIAIVTGKIIHTTPILALLRGPQLIWHVLPFVLQIVLLLLIVVGQFAAIFWFMSRGGVDVYYPDDIKTRFSDVWGQDHVLERVKENIIFLEHPELVEERGGYVPGGLLLWGPPGTGKTLMAEAVAGETGRPYVFVDPGAFINMFMGVGILKVKSLFRKLADGTGRGAAAPGPHRPHLQGRLSVQGRRIRTYEGYFAKVQHELTEEQMDKLATITPYATGATIKDLVNESLITAIRNGRDVITWPDVIKAKQLKELGPPEDVEYIERERHAVAVHEACHALVAFRTRQHMEIDIATIEKGSDYLGMVASIPPEDTVHPSGAADYEADDPGLASRRLAGERMFFAEATAPPACARGPGDRDTRWPRSWRATGAWGPRCPRTPRPSGSRSDRRAAAGVAR